MPFKIKDRVCSHQGQEHGQDVLVDQVLGIIDQDVAIIRLQGGAVSRAKNLYLHPVSQTRTEQPNTGPEQQQSNRLRVMTAASPSADRVRVQETPHTASCDGSAQTPSARGPLSRDDSVCLRMRHSARTRGQNRCPVVPPPAPVLHYRPHPALTSGEPPRRASIIVCPIMEAEHLKLPSGFLLPLTDRRATGNLSLP